MEISGGTMKFKELKKLTDIEREKKTKELKIELIKANYSKTGGKARQIKKMISRINTIISLKKGEVKKNKNEK